MQRPAAAWLPAPVRAADAGRVLPSGALRGGGPGARGRCGAAGGEPGGGAACGLRARAVGVAGTLAADSATAAPRPRARPPCARSGRLRTGAARAPCGATDRARRPGGRTAGRLVRAGRDQRACVLRRQGPGARSLSARRRARLKPPAGRRERRAPRLPSIMMISGGFIFRNHCSFIEGVRFFFF